MQKILTEWRKYLVEQQKYVSAKQHAETLRMVRANPGSCINDEGLYSGKNTPECKRQRAAKAAAPAAVAKKVPREKPTISKRPEQIKQENALLYKTKKEQHKAARKKLHKMIEKTNQYEMAATDGPMMPNYWGILGMLEDEIDADIEHTLNPRKKGDPTYQAQQLINKYEYSQKVNKHLQALQKKIYSKPFWKHAGTNEEPEIMAAIHDQIDMTMSMLKAASRWQAAAYR